VILKEDSVKISRRMAALSIAALITIGSPIAAHAQSRISVDARGGVAVPASDLADLEDVGASLGIGFAYALSSRVSLRIDGDADILSGSDSGVSGSSAPDLNIFHYGGGVAVSLLEPGSSRWNLAVNVGAGAATFDSDTFSANGVSQDFSETYFSTNGGLRIGYDLSSRVNLYASGQAYLMFTDDADTAIFGQVSSEVDPSGFDTAWTIPLTAGLAIQL